MFCRILFIKRDFFKPVLAVFLIFTCSASLLGQKENYRSIIGKPYGERQLFLLRNFYINDGLRSDSVRYFNEVARLLKLAKENNDLELILECDFLKYNYLSSKHYRDYIPEMEHFLTKVDKNKIRQLQARARQAIGFHYYYELSDYLKAYSYFKDSYSYIRQLSVEELPDKQELLYNIAFVYYNIGYEFQALKYLDQAEELDNNYYNTLECNIINTKGLIYKKEGNISGALVNFKKTLSLAKKINSDIWVRIAKNNIAGILSDQKDYAAAKEFLDELPKPDSVQSEETGRVKARHRMLLGKIYAAENDWPSFFIETKELKLLDKKFKLPIELKKDIYHLISIEYRQNGNFEQAYFYNEKVLEFADNYYKLKNNEGLKQALEKEKIESLMQEQLKTEHQKKLNSRTQALMAVIMCLIMVFSAILLKRQKKAFTRQKQEVESELSEANEKLLELVADLKYRNKEVEAYEEELAKIYKDFPKEGRKTTERKKTLEELLSKPIMTDTKWMVFKRTFDQAHPDYHDKLQKAIPSISMAEIRYMYLRKLKLTPKEIAFVLGVSQGSIRQYKHRIRCKVSPEIHSDFETFLDEI